MGADVGVFPSYLTEQLEHLARESYHPREGTGLTKRELFAAMAMQAYIAKDANACAQRAVQMADALLAELKAKP